MDELVSDGVRWQFFDKQGDLFGWEAPTSASDLAGAPRTLPAASPIGGPVRSVATARDLSRRHPASALAHDAALAEIASNGLVDAKWSFGSMAEEEYPIWGALSAPAGGNAVVRVG